jgi:hypothetical protein
MPEEHFDELEHEGVRELCESYAGLLACIGRQVSGTLRLHNQVTDCTRR